MTSPPLDGMKSKKEHFMIENNAYRRLRAHGLCNKGYIPMFYGAVENFDSDQICEPRLEFFKMREQTALAGIFLEYIPGMYVGRESVGWCFSQERWAKFLEIMKAIIAARVIIPDADMRSVVLYRREKDDQPEKEERIVTWDFEGTKLFPDDKILSKMDRRDLMLSYKDVVDWGKYLVSISFHLFYVFLGRANYLICTKQESRI
jgi:hypothetical protein